MASLASLVLFARGDKLGEENRALNEKLTVVGQENLASSKRNTLLTKENRAIIARNEFLNQQIRSYSSLALAIQDTWRQREKFEADLPRSVSDRLHGMADRFNESPWGIFAEKLQLLEDGVNRLLSALEHRDQDGLVSADPEVVGELHSIALTLDPGFPHAARMQLAESFEAHAVEVHQAVSEYRLAFTVAPDVAAEDQYQSMRVRLDEKLEFLVRDNLSGVEERRAASSAADTAALLMDAARVVARSIESNQIDAYKSAAIADIADKDLAQFPTAENVESAASARGEPEKR